MIPNEGTVFINCYIKFENLDRLRKFAGRTLGQRHGATSPGQHHLGFLF